MELQELKNIWTEYDKKLDKTLQINMKLLRKMNFDKIANKATTLLMYKLIEMAILLFMMIYLYSFAIQYFTVPEFCISALLTAGFITAGFVSDIRQVIIAAQLRADYAAPIAPIQKKIVKLKMLIVNYVKGSLFSIPFFPFLLLLAGKIMFDIDFWEAKRRTYFITNVGLGLVLLPVFIWLYLQLNKRDVKRPWIKGLLVGSGWNQAQAAENFLKEIQDFEIEE
jgi:hypothetical protein